MPDFRAAASEVDRPIAAAEEEVYGARFLLPDNVRVEPEAAGVPTATWEGS